MCIRDRSTSAEKFFKLTDEKDITFVVLQKGNKKNDFIKGDNLIDVSSDIDIEDGFIDTAAIIESLDLVISCAQNLDLNTTKYFEHLNLSQNTLLYDINYSNQTNKLFSDLSIVGKNNFYNGIGMLVEQASECFKLWFNKKPEVEEIKSKLNERL